MIEPLVSLAGCCGAGPLSRVQGCEPGRARGAHPEGQVHRGELRLHVGVGQDALIIAQADPFHFGIGLVGGKIREAQPDGPDQRKDVDRQQKEDRRGYEQPGDGPV